MSDERMIHIERSTSTAHRLGHYDGVCGNVHGHNMRWEVTAQVDMSETGDDNMPVDFKDISDLIDETDHAILLNTDEIDELNALIDNDYEDCREILEEYYGDVIWFTSDPTCEMVSQWMADQLVDEIEAIEFARVKVAETDKYEMEAQAEE